MIEDRYTPDGWLGFIVGAKYWIDFKDTENIETSLDNLLKEVKKHSSIQHQKIGTNSVFEALIKSKNKPKQMNFVIYRSFLEINNLDPDYYNLYFLFYI